jgi:N-acetylglucosaminyldiphosphoundecaprenol N-acetyl-beta-D-mannosaminyltransferase
MRLSENTYSSRTVRFAGLRVQPLDVDETVQALAARDPAAPFGAFVTPNIEHIWLVRKHPRMRQVMDTAPITVNDSRILLKAGRLAGLDLKFAPGSYVIPPLFEDVIQPGDALSLIGGTPELADKVRARFGLTRLVQHIPPMGFIANPDAVRAAADFVAANPSRFVIVAMGPPQSELLCATIIEDGRSTGLGLCVGSSLLTLTGESKPAPDWMERNSLVWLYRLTREPRRLWRRYVLRGGYGVLACLADILAIRLRLKDPYAQG